MKKYKIKLSGRGAECYLHNLTESKKEQLLELDIENDESDIDYEQINEILNVDHYDQTDDIITGVYNNPENFHITVMDNSGNTIWESEDSYVFNLPDDLDANYRDHYKDNQLTVQNYIKGDFFEYELEIKEDFNPQKLTPIFTEVNEVVDLITGLRYNGKELEVVEFGDNWSKGVYFHIT